MNLKFPSSSRFALRGRAGPGRPCGGRPLGRGGLGLRLGLAGLLGLLGLGLTTLGCSSETILDSPDPGPTTTSSDENDDRRPATADPSTLRRCRLDAPAFSVGSDEQVRELAGCEYLEEAGFTLGFITDLSPLSTLRIVEGNISGGGYETRPFTLDGLTNLERVDGRLQFLGDNILSFTGVPNLREVGGELWLQGVPNLANLDGLEHLRSLGKLTISGNPKLMSLRGLAGLEEVRGDLGIVANDALPEEEVRWLIARVRVGGRTFPEF